MYPETYDSVHKAEWNQTPINVMGNHAPALSRGNRKLNETITPTEARGLKGELAQPYDDGMGGPAFQDGGNKSNY